MMAAIATAKKKAVGIGQSGGHAPPVFQEVKHHLDATTADSGICRI